MSKPILVCIRTPQDANAHTTRMLDDIGLLGAVRFFDTAPPETRWATYVRAARAVVAEEAPAPILFMDAGVVPRRPRTTVARLRSAMRVMGRRPRTWHVVMLGWNAVFVNPRDALFGSMLGALRLMLRGCVDTEASDGADGLLVGPAGGFDPCVFCLSAEAAAELARADGTHATTTLARWLRSDSGGRWREGTLCAVPRIFTQGPHADLYERAAGHASDLLAFVRLHRAPFLAATVLAALLLSLCAALVLPPLWARLRDPVHRRGG